MIKPVAPAEWIASEGKVQLSSNVFLYIYYSFQELVWKRSSSANVKMYELTIKQDEEKALSFEVEDIEDPLNDVYCRGEVAFTLPSDFAFEVGSKYKINVYR